MPQEEIYLFVAEWFDPRPMLKRQYVLKYFVETHSCEMFDIKNNRLFLKKSPLPSNITKSDMTVGSRVLIYGREIDIVDYGDKTTKTKLEVDMEGALVILPYSLCSNWGNCLSKFYEGGMVLKKLRTLFLDSNNVSQLSSMLQQDCSILENNLSVAINVAGSGGTARMIELLNELNLTTSVICATSAVNAMNVMNVISLQQTTVTLDNCTCCVVKPHAVKSGDFGNILDQITSQGYEVSAMETVHFDRTTAEEFLEIYKDVIPDFPDHITQLCSGIAVAIELRAQDAVTTFRESCGPWDVQMAKELRPQTLRAKFGVDNIRSAVYCTDLPADGSIDCEYCFKIMS